MVQNHKKRRIAFIVPILAILLISTIGVGYAVWGDVHNTSNTTDAQYITVTPQGATAYSEAFNKTLEFNTENRNGTITYTLCSEQLTEITVSETNHNAVLLGELLLRIQQTGGSEDYSLMINNIAGTMTGTFYTAISTSEDNSTYSSWTYANYTIGTGSSFNVDDSIEYIKLRLYVDSSFQSPGGSLATMPLNGVTFRIMTEV